MPLQIQHDAAANRFHATLEGEVAELGYLIRGSTLVIEHTHVPERIGGQGIAAQLVEAAVRDARARNLGVAATCSYAAAYLQKHGNPSGAGEAGA